MENAQPDPQTEKIDGLEKTEGASWGDYPLDEMLIRQESRTVHDVIRRIKKKHYVMDPDFQRDFIWPEDKQSKLIESVIMRIPLPVFYLAEDEDGRVMVVDGLQRLSTFDRFVGNKLKLRLSNREELHGKQFQDLPPKLQNRVEDCNLTFYVIDSKAPERARLDIFERVNGGVPLTRQQMRNSLFMGKATRFLKTEAKSDLFRQVTGNSLNTKTMRDREFVNRFCAFRILPAEHYREMDEFLAESLRKMNQQSDEDLSQLSRAFSKGLANNYLLFGRNAFRKHIPEQQWRGVLNASLWDVMCTGLSRYSKEQVEAQVNTFRDEFYMLLENDDFNKAISLGTNDLRQVRHRFEVAGNMIEEVLGAPTNRT